MNLISTKTYFGLKTKFVERATEQVSGLMFQDDELVITWNAPSNMVLLYLMERSLDLYVNMLNNYKKRQWRYTSSLFQGRQPLNLFEQRFAAIDHANGKYLPDKMKNKNI